MKYNNSLLYEIMDKSISPQKFKEYNESMAIAEKEINTIIDEELDTTIYLEKTTKDYTKQVRKLTYYNCHIKVVTNFSCALPNTIYT